MTPEFLVGFIILVIGTIISAFPGKRDYLTRLINLEIPAFGLLLVALSYDETLALMTFIAVSTLSTFVMVLLIERSGESA
jgi:energy-converting hydrogenase A subunit E